MWAQHPTSSSWTRPTGSPERPARATSHAALNITRRAASQSSSSTSSWCSASSSSSSSSCAATWSSSARVHEQVQMQRNAEVKRRALWMVCNFHPGCVHHLFRVSHHSVQLPWTLAELGFQDTDFHQGINDAHQVTLCLLSTNCVLDPIIYCFLTKKFRKHLTEKLHKVRESREVPPGHLRDGTEVVVQPKDAPIKSLKY